jgi:outer membrane immunogenic protein
VGVIACSAAGYTVLTSWGITSMRLSKLLLTTAVASVGFSNISVAADLPARTYTKAPSIVQAAYDWSGFYIGANAGGAISNNCWNLTSAIITTGPGGGLISPGPEGCHNATGGTAGGQIGYRWQMSSMVFGLEAQGNWSRLRGDNISTLIGDDNQTTIDGFGLFTGQIGYAWNATLLYVKGGAAVTRNSYRIFDIPNGTLTDTAGDTRWGATVGAGLEYGFAPNWSVSFEYDHMFMGGHDVTFINVANGAPDGGEHIKQDVDLFTARLNYKFGGPAVARY